MGRGIYMLDQNQAGSLCPGLGGTFLSHGAHQAEPAESVLSCPVPIG